ncbi:DUF6491 family protein [Stenotrophomonas sp. 24(2023)]|uniref:DUF6491 family protein n=1 Tax=Stenotrophomonas sp. 24(2023) TaxID=3068324 RepID=UPI0027E1A747|nr:DUF6491 family protein [Stenotrophomonas sp. 24(2023)]WMJ68989.1 DUF6491 family protein [Stenotrophomonas sp. 24(2023)]
MTLHRVALSTGLGLVLAVAAASSAAQERLPPAPHCMDTAGVTEVEQASPRSIAVRAASGQAYRIDFSEDCPGTRTAGRLALEAPGGFACGRPSERVTVDGHACTVSAVTPVDNRDFASVARNSDRLRVATLPAMTISQRRDVRRSFGGSPSFCFATRNVRAWSSDAGGILVETNPARNGGYRYYRVELGSACNALDRAPEVRFHSGLQNGLICGNPGDRMVSTPLDAGDERGRTIVPATPDRCQILAVYPEQRQASR